MTPRIRAARAEDAVICARILGAFFTETTWLPRIHTPAQDLAFVRQLIGKGQVRVMDRGGLALGFIAREGDEIGQLYVDRPHRRGGIGAALVQEAQGVRNRLGLWTFQANTEARRFYERLGFRPVRFGDGSHNEERVPDVRLEWEAAR